MAASFFIADGNPDIYMSDWIWCKRTAALPAGWAATDDAPPGAFWDPFYREDNWVWVKVHQTGAVSGQTAGLYMFAGIEGIHLADHIRDPANWFTPTGRWSTAQWQEQLLVGKVCHIPWFNGIGTQDSCPISNPAYQPGDLASKWYEFKWERDLVPPPSSCTGMNIALLAYVMDSAVTGVTDFTVEGNPRFSQRNCIIV